MRWAIVGVWSVLALASAAMAQDVTIEAGAPVVEQPVPTVEVIIVGPSEASYSLYGHAAMRVALPGEAVDDARVFNFGITNFKRPNYVLDFLGGRVKFWGKIERWATVLRRWSRSDRTVTRYPVLLPADALRALVARMERDTQPEHREFVYDTFRENCATRLRDYLDTYSRGAVHQATANTPSGRAFRQDVRHAYSNSTSILLGTEIVPGVDLDAPRSVWEMMYRPEALGDALRTVTLADGSPLLGPGITDHRRAGADPLDGSPQHGQIILLVIALLFFVLGWFIHDRGPRIRGGTLAGIVLLSTALGVLLLWVASMTDWPDMQRNPLIFALVPLDLFLLWPALRLFIDGETGPAPIARWYLLARLTVGGVLVLLTPLIGALNGPIPPRLLAVSWVFVMWRCLDGRRS